jgi:prevent-host-death family protein
MDVATSPQNTAGVREVKNHLSAYLDRVREGEEIVITDRGRPVARLTSLEPEVDRLELLLEQGLIIRPTATRSRPRRRVSATGPIAELVAAERR